MKKSYLTLVALVLIFSCARNPVTHRAELDLVPNSQVMSLADTQYTSFLPQNKLSTNAEQTALVEKVGRNIADAVTSYLASVNQSKQIEGYNWEFHLVESDQINAWCMPGGKVVVYTGLIPVAQNENGLAVVLGHEISHAVARHGNERMSEQLLQQTGESALSVALANKPALTQKVFMAAIGAGSQVGIMLPFSREQESEADHMGLIFMSVAGYNPQGALDFWKRMMASDKTSKSALLSDHPSDQNRLAAIEKEMPEAMGYYQKAAVKR